MLVQAFTTAEEKEYMNIAVHKIIKYVNGRSSGAWLEVHAALRERAANALKMK